MKGTKVNRKKIGNSFQEDFQESIPSYLYWERYKDSPVHFKHVDNVADHFIFEGNYMLLVECKTTQEKHLPLQNIRLNQIWKMMNACIKTNTCGGLLINFRSIGETYFIFVDDFVYWYLNCRASSISKSWIQEHGYQLSQVKKISRWRYGVKGLLRWVKEVRFNGN